MPDVAADRQDRAAAKSYYLGFGSVRHAPRQVIGRDVTSVCGRMGRVGVEFHSHDIGAFPSQAEPNCKACRRRATRAPNTPSAVTDDK